MRLLIVTSHETDLQFIEQVLADDGLACETVWVTGDADALDRLQTDTFALILFDLAGRSGFDSFARLVDRKLDIPLIFFTETGNEILARRALELGADDYVIKDPGGGFLTLLPPIIRRVHQRWKEALTTRQTSAELSEDKIKDNLIIDAMGDGIHVIDNKLRLVLVNKALVQWNEELGLDTDIIGKTVYEAFHFLSDKVRDEYRWVFESGRPLVTTEENDVNGKIVFTETRKIPIVGEHSVNQVMTIVRDITEQVESKKSLAKSRETLDHAQKIAHLGSWETDLITGKIFWSEELEHILGINPAEYDYDTLKILKKIVHPADLDVVINTSLQAMGEAIKENPAIEDETVDIPAVEYRIIMPEGAEKVVLADGNILFRAGHPIKIVGTIQDVTERKSVETEIRRQTAQLDAIRRLGLEITAQLDLDSLLHSIVSQSISLVNGSSGGLYLYLPAQNVLQLTTCVGPDLPAPGKLLHRGEGLAGKVWETGQPLIVENYQQWEGRATIYDVYPWTSVIGVPIRWGVDADSGEFLGVLDILGRPTKIFSPADVDLLDMFATQAAIAIRNVQLYKFEQQKREEADTLREAVLALTTALHLQDVIERILAQLQQVVPYDTCSVQLFRQNRGEGQLEIVGGRGFPNLSEIRGLIFDVGGDNPNTEVVRTRSRVVVDNAPEVYGDFRKEPHIQAGIHSWLGVPMLIGNRLVGMIALDKKEPKSYTREHAQLAEVFAAQAAVAVENARLYEEAQQQTEMMSVLLNEVNHRVKNNLTGIIGLLYVARSRAKVEDQASYEATMDELIGRVRGLASVHTMLSESQWTPLQLTSLANEIIHAALRALPYGKQVTVNISPSPVRITADQAHNLALIINELATNTAKYALQNRDTAEIIFETTMDDRTIICEFYDDGPGYPDEVLQLAHHGVGFNLIRNIIQSNLRGELLLKNRNGAVVEIRFKAEV